MTMHLNKKTRRYEPITNPEDIPAVSWMEQMNCCSNQEQIDELWKKGRRHKKKILKQMKREGKTTVKEYYETKRKLGY